MYCLFWSADQGWDVDELMVRLDMMDPYHIAQMRILQGRQEELITEFASRMGDLYDTYGAE